SCASSATVAFACTPASLWSILSGLTPRSLCAGGARMAPYQPARSYRDLHLLGAGHACGRADLRRAIPAVFRLSRGPRGPGGAAPLERPRDPGLRALDL